MAQLRKIGAQHQDRTLVVPAAPRLRLKAETLVQWLPAAFAWVRNLVLQGPLQRCWTPEQRPILEQLLAGFQQQGGNADALKAHFAQEKIAPTLRDFLEMQRHGLAVAGGEDTPGAFSFGRANGAEIIGRARPRFAASIHP